MNLGNFAHNLFTLPQNILSGYANVFQQYPHDLQNSLFGHQPATGPQMMAGDWSSMGQTPQPQQGPQWSMPQVPTYQQAPDVSGGPSLPQLPPMMSWPQPPRHNNNAWDQMYGGRR